MLHTAKYFIIPRFNQQIDIRKLKDTQLYQESEMISRFYDGENKICLLFVKTKEKTDPATVREHIEPISTVLSNCFITAKELEFNSLVLHFYNVPSILREEHKFNMLLSSFGKIKFIDYYTELNYYTIEFSSIQNAKFAASFITSIPFATQKKNICVSDNPFDMPFVSLKLNNYFDEFYLKLDCYFSQYNIIFLNSVIDQNKKRIIIQTIGKKTVKKIIKKFNFAKYRDDIIYANWYIPNTFYLNKIKYFQIRVPTNFMINDETTLLRFYQDFERYGPIYKVKKTNDFFGEIQYQNLETAQRLLQGNQDVILTKARSYSVYNFPPDITNNDLVDYFLSGNIWLLYIKGPITNPDIWPYCEIIIKIEDTVKLKRHLDEKTCKFTYPLCLPSYQNDDFQSIFLSFRNNNNSVELDYQTCSHIDIYNKYSRFGLFVMFQIDAAKNKMYITFDSQIAANRVTEQCNGESVLFSKSVGNKTTLNLTYPKKKAISIVKRPKPTETQTQTYMSPVFLQDS